MDSLQEEPTGTSLGRDDRDEAREKDDHSTNRQQPCIEGRSPGYGKSTKETDTTDPRTGRTEATEQTEKTIQ